MIGQERDWDFYSQLLTQQYNMEAGDITGLSPFTSIPPRKLIFHASFYRLPVRPIAIPTSVPAYTPPHVLKKNPLHHVASMNKTEKMTREAQQRYNSNHDITGYISLELIAGDVVFITQPRPAPFVDKDVKPSESLSTASRCNALLNLTRC